MTPAERIEAAGRWLVTVGGQATSGDLGVALGGLNHSRQAEVTKALRAQGLVEGPRGQVQLTAACWSRFGGAATTESAGEVLDRALTGWPQTHRAFVELMAAAVIARHHLGTVRPEGHLGFMAIGPTRTGKSAAGRLICHLFGWTYLEHLVHVPAESPGSLLGRQEKAEGGDWQFVPAPMTGWPFVILDEWDKADRDVQRAGWRYFDGKVRVRAETATGYQQMRPTPLLTANFPLSGDPYQALRPEYRARSVVYDTTALTGRSRELSRLLRQLSPADRLDLDCLVPPAQLDDAALAILEAAEELLTEAGREELDLPSLELATLGRLALLGAGADHELAALATVVAYAQVTETRPGHVRPGWGLEAAWVRQQHGTGADVTALLAAIDRGRHAQEQARQVVQEGRRRKDRTELAVLEAGATLAARCRRLHGQLDGRRLGELPVDQRDAADGLRRTLRTLGTRAAQVSTEAALRDVQAQAADPLQRAGQLVAAAAAARQQRATDAADARRQAQEDRRAAQQGKALARANAAAARQHRREQLEAVMAAIKPLETHYARKSTKPGENPLAVLRRLRDGWDQPLLVYVPPAPVPAPTTLRGRLAQALTGAPSGHWQVTGSGLRFAGTAASCPALATWGPSTRAVLAPALAALHALEDQLRAGRRQGRPRVDPAAAAIVRPLPSPAGGRPALPVAARR